MQPILYFAADHAGFELKEILVPFARDILGYEVVDCGARVLDTEDDFTDYIAQASREVSANPKGAKAIILGGSGQGEAMLANRFHTVRAAVYYGGNQEILKLSRIHNDANVLSLGARFLSIEEAKKAVMMWLHTAHVPIEKYDRRIAQTDSIHVEQTVQTNVLPVSVPSEPRTVQTPPGLQRSIAPSLPAQSFAEISTLLQKLIGVAKEIQVDIVDGTFVHYTSWPFTETDVIAELVRLQPYVQHFELEIDCMCVHPEIYLDTFAAVGVQRVIIHAGSTEMYEECIMHAHTHGYKIGIALLNTTPPSLIDTYAGHIDFVQVMGISNIGVQGQPFDEQTLNTVAELRKKYPALEIAVDGAVNESTIPRLLAVGVNRFAPGSAIAQSSDPVLSYKQLAHLIGL